MRALVVHAHPVADSFVAAVRDRVVRGLQAGGHVVDLLDLHAVEFEPCLSAAEWEAHRSPLSAKDPGIQQHAERLRRADALVLVYPTWWGGPPAILKGWIDRVWVEGAAYELVPETARVRPLLRRLRRLIVVTTHGSPKWINAVEGEPGKRLVGRQLRSLSHPLARTRWIALYNVDAGDAAGRAAFLDRVERRLSRRRL